MVGLHIGVPLSIAVGVENECGPALRLLLIVGFFEHLGVQPADHPTATAGPQRVVGILGKLQVVRAETRAHECDLPGFRIVRGKVALAGGNREKLRRRTIRIRFAHTSPVYVQVGDGRGIVPEDAKFFIDWIDREVNFYEGYSGFRSEQDRQAMLEIYRKARAVYVRLAKP
ncbi:MAG: hypothetical protein DMG25_12300 [Acidobacteria bacterium]|nr:MAG: hypothetical protein DMG25_12300 [Acidobacteriota bacterium]PYV26288.1 MAG: hypothetical protein DMG27_07210 [Acidobacteriota bacterium]